MPPPPLPPNSALPPPLPSQSGPSFVPPKRRGSSFGLRVIIVLCLLLTAGVVIVGARIYRDIKGEVTKLVDGATRRNPHRVEAPKYETLVGQGLIGSGFHVQIGSRRYICSSLHQFDDTTPKEMLSMQFFEEPIFLKDVVHQQEDLLLISYVSKKLDEVPPLNFEFDTKVEAGLPIYLYPMDGVPTKGHITLVNERENKATVRVNLPFAAAGMSGSPVVSGETGTVIGILIDANDPQRATKIGIQLLKPKRELAR